MAVKIVNRTQGKAITLSPEKGGFSENGTPATRLEPGETTWVADHTEYAQGKPDVWGSISYSGSRAAVGFWAYRPLGAGYDSLGFANDLSNQGNRDRYSVGTVHVKQELGHGFRVTKEQDRDEDFEGVVGGTDYARFVIEVTS